MINMGKRVHDEAWKAEFASKVNLTFQTLSVFGTNDFKKASSYIRRIIDDEQSVYRKFLEAFYDQTLLDAEFSYASENGPEKEKAFRVNASRKKAVAVNKQRFNDVMMYTYMWFQMSSPDGRVFISLLEVFFGKHPEFEPFTAAFYDSVMFLTRCSLIEKNAKH